jgi:hypothetical protein
MDELELIKQVPGKGTGKSWRQVWTGQNCDVLIAQIGDLYVFTNEIEKLFYLVLQ